MSFLESGIDTFKERIKHKGVDHLYEFGCLALSGNQYSQHCLEQALSCFRQSAVEFNNLISQFNVGLMYRKGLGVQKNEEEAFNFFKLSAENGYEKAQVLVGIYYLEGKCVTQDYLLAHHWLRLAMSQGNADSYYYISIIYNEGLGVKSDKYLALDYLKTSADLGFHKAQRELGQYLFLQGDSHSEYVKSFRYLKLAAAQNDEKAQHFLSTIYLNEKTTAFCPQKGLDLLKALARKNYVDALMDLGFLFKRGTHVNKDISKAQSFFKRAKNLGSEKAFQLLEGSDH